MTASSLRVIVTGFIGHQRLLGGVAWDYLNVVLGMKRLGHDVYYIEDSGCWPYNDVDGPSGGDWTDWNPQPTVEHLSKVMSAFGLDHKWAYQFPPKSEWFGLSSIDRKEIIEIGRPAYQCIRNSRKAVGLSNSKEINLYRYGSSILSNRSGNRR